MIALYILLGLIALIGLLLSSPVSLHFYYRDDPRLTLRVWGIPFRLLPAPPKKEKETAASDTAKTREKEKPPLLEELQTTFRQDGLSAALQWLKRLAAVFSKAIGRLFRAVTVKNLRLEMRISGDDAADVAVRYGEVCAVLFPVLAVIIGNLRVKRQTVDIRPDFSEAGTAVLVDCRLGVSLWRLAGAAVGFGWGMLRLSLSSEKAEETDEQKG